MEEFTMSNLHDLRNYLHITNVDIFEFLKMAIRVAAADRPHDFRAERDNIAETLYRRYSCDLINHNASTSEYKDEVNRKWRHVAANQDLPVDQQEPKQDMPIKPSFKLRLKVKRTATDTEKDTVAKGPDAPDLILENSTNVIDQVLRIKEVIGRSIKDESVLCDSLKKLQNVEMSIETLQKTGIGKTVSLLRKHVSKDVSESAMKLVKTWKDMVDETRKKKSSIAKPVSEIAKNQQKPRYSDMKTRDQKGPTSTTNEKKLEVSKNKLHRSYAEIESMKKKRKIQVLQLHQLPPQPVNKRLKR